MIPGLDATASPTRKASAPARGPARPGRARPVPAPHRRRGASAPPAAASTTRTRAWWAPFRAAAAARAPAPAPPPRQVQRDDLALGGRQSLDRGRHFGGIEYRFLTPLKPRRLAVGRQRVAAAPALRRTGGADRGIADDAVQPGRDRGRRRGLPQ